MSTPILKRRWFSVVACLLVINVWYLSTVASTHPFLLIFLLVDSLAVMFVTVLDINSFASLKQKLPILNIILFTFIILLTTYLVIVALV